MSSFSIVTLWNEKAELARVEEFVTGYCERYGLPVMEMNLVAEECFVNIVEHGFPTKVDLSMEMQGASVTMTFEDDGVAFDPLSVPEFDPATPMEQRRVGGLGIHLVRTIMDELHYEREDGKNRLTMRRALERRD